MEVTWDPSAYNGIAGYRIYYSELALPSDMDQWRTVDVGPYTVAEVPGLEPHSAYAVRVRAKSVVDARLSNFSEIAYTNRLNQGLPPCFVAETLFIYVSVPSLTSLATAVILSTYAGASLSLSSTEVS